MSIIKAERLSGNDWVKTLHDKSRRDLKAELLSHPDFAGAFWFDVKTHEFERWLRPALEADLKVPDSRLVLSQLKATETRQTQMGPVLMIHGTLYNTIAQPLDARHAVVVLLDGSG